MHNTRYIVIIFILVSQSVLAQKSIQYGLPFIRYYSPETFEAYPQIWTIAQDKRGLLYFGTNVGVLEYDGHKWRLIELSEESTVRSMAIGKDNRIYVGATREFGFLSPDTGGKLNYHKISNQLNLKFNNVWRTFHLHDSIYFIADHEQFYLYANDNLEKLPISQTLSYFKAFVIEHDIYIADSVQGLFRYANKSLNKLSKNNMLKNKIVNAILPYLNKKLIIASRLHGLFIYDPDKKGDNNIYPFKTQIDDFFENNQVYDAIRLSNGNFAIITLLGGVVIINEAGELVTHFNNKKGLPTSSIYSILEDADRNLWLGHDKGISYLEINSPFTLFDETTGIDGTINCMLRLDHEYLIGTSAGIYRKPLYENRHYLKKNLIKTLSTKHIFIDDFYRIKHTQPGQSDVLLATSLREINRIENGVITKVMDLYGGFWFEPSANIKNRVFVAHPEGILALRYSQKKDKIQVEYEGKIEQYNESVESLVTDSVKGLWASTMYDGLSYFKFNKNEDLNKYQYFKIDTTNGLPSMQQNVAFRWKNQLFSCTENGIYKLQYQHIKDPESYYFIPDTSFGIDFRKQKFEVNRVVADKRNNLFIATNNSIICYLSNQDSVLAMPFKRIRDNLFTEIMVEDDHIWFISDKYLFHYDIHAHKEYNNAFNCYVRKVMLNNDSAIYHGYNHNLSSIVTEHPNSIKYRNNSLQFEFAAPFYEKASYNQYAYLLEGFDKNWSKWSTETKAVYTNIPPGTYNFKVKSLNVYDRESETAIFSFTILPPWYRTFLAYFIYLLLIIIIYRLLVLINTRRLKAANIRLENIIQDRTAEIVQQKEELEAQAELLSKSNKELEKLSIVASKTTNAITIMDASGHFQWVNEGFTNFYELTLEEFKMTRGKNIFACTADPEILELLQKCFKNKITVNYEFSTFTRSGKKVNVQTTITPILDDHGDISKLISIDTDISKLKEAEKEIIKQRDEITTQKLEITDSILYSKHIQTALFPTREMIDKIIPKSFILNLPREIIGGDFYWIAQKNGKKIIAVADCTGHGVPGALMSMLGITLLNEIVVHRGITDPAEILNELRLKVIQSLHQTAAEDSPREGMDASVCTIDDKRLYFAGANQSCIIVNNNDFAELVGDKMSVRLDHNENTPFTQLDKSLNKEDTVFLFTDGFADQFGGDQNRKFRMQQMRELLKNVADLSPDEQKTRILTKFTLWKADQEQIDDVLILGFSIG